MASPMVIVATIFLTIVFTLVFQAFSSGERKVRYQVETLYTVDDPQFERAMGHLLGPPVVGGNKIVGLLNGTQIFPAMLAAVRKATRSVTFETYIYWSGEIGREFSEALVERAAAGVRVHVLLDWLGSEKLDEAMLQRMRDAGVQVEKYRPLRWYNLSRINSRTHRKLLVVDGTIGFTGGVGIADQWQGNGDSPEHWRDSHFQLEGPAVAQLQAAFMDNWIKTRSEVLHGDDYFPLLPETGSIGAQVFKSSPREGSSSVRLMYLMSIAAAQNHILLANSYFVPDSLCIAALVAAKRRGVRIEIIVPGPLIDTGITRRASRSRWGKLLEVGIEILEFQPTMYHCKVMVIDGLWLSVGSTNFDNRSFRLNDEANLNAFDRELAQEQTRAFEDDKRRSKQVTLAQWRNRPLREKLIEHIAGLLRSQL